MGSEHNGYGAHTAIFVYNDWASAIYLGADLPMRALLAIPLSVIVRLFYALYSAAMSRSGGDYIWISRNPTLADCIAHTKNWRGAGPAEKREFIPRLIDTLLSLRFP